MRKILPHYQARIASCWTTKALKSPAQGIENRGKSDNIDIEHHSIYFTFCYLEQLYRRFWRGLYNLKNSPIYAVLGKNKEIRKKSNRISKSDNKGQSFFVGKPSSKNNLTALGERVLYPNSDGIEILDVEDNASKMSCSWRTKRHLLGFGTHRKVPILLKSLIFRYANTYMHRGIIL